MTKHSNGLNETRDHPIENRFPYHPSAYFRGTFYWSCPQCGSMNRDRLQPMNWRVRCKYAYCRRMFPLGVIFYVQHPGCRPWPPRDHWVVEPELGVYRPGDRVNKLRIMKPTDLESET